MKTLDLNSIINPNINDEYESLLMLINEGKNNNQSALWYMDEKNSPELVKVSVKFTKISLMRFFLIESSKEKLNEFIKKYEIDGSFIQSALVLIIKEKFKCMVFDLEFFYDKETKLIHINIYI